MKCYKEIDRENYLIIKKSIFHYSFIKNQIIITNNLTADEIFKCTENYKPYEFNLFLEKINILQSNILPLNSVEAKELNFDIKKTFNPAAAEPKMPVAYYEAEIKRILSNVSKTLDISVTAMKRKGKLNIFRQEDNKIDFAQRCYILEVYKLHKNKINQTMVGAPIDKSKTFVAKTIDKIRTDNEFIKKYNRIFN